MDALAEPFEREFFVILRPVYRPSCLEGATENAVKVGMESQLTLNGTYN